MRDGCPNCGCESALRWFHSWTHHKKGRRFLVPGEARLVARDAPPARHGPALWSAVAELPAGDADLRSATCVPADRAGRFLVLRACVQQKPKSYLGQCRCEIYSHYPRETDSW